MYVLPLFSSKDSVMMFYYNDTKTKTTKHIMVCHYLSLPYCCVCFRRLRWFFKKPKYSIMILNIFSILFNSSLYLFSQIICTGTFSVLSRFTFQNLFIKMNGRKYNLVYLIYFLNRLLFCMNLYCSRCLFENHKIDFLTAYI